MRLRQFAANAKGKALARRVEAATAALHAARNTKVARAIRHFRHLRQNASRLHKGLEHMPQRTGAAMARKMQRVGTLSLGHVAGLIDPDQVDRYAARTTALQRAEPVADAFETHGKAPLQ